MSKWANDNMMDASLDYVALSTLMIVCSAQPTTYAEATVTYALADVAMAPGDFTKANGDASGRKVTMAAKNAVTIDANGTSSHVALVTVATSTLRYVTTCDAANLVMGAAVNFPAWDIEVYDPA